jgi:hypothetical protein
MAKDPAFLFYSSDFLVGTMTMTDEQVGKYIKLLCLQHQKKQLSEKDMLNICKSYDEDIYCKFKKTPEGFYINERLYIESEKRNNYSLSRRNNRKLVLTYLDEDMKNICLTCVNHMENENENENINKDINEVCNSCFKKSKFKKSKSEKSKIEVLKTDLVFPFETEEFYKFWNIWKEYKQKEHSFKYKSELSEQAALKSLSELSNGNEAIALKIIEQSISNSWQGFFKLKNDDKQTDKNGNRRNNGITEDYRQKLARDIQAGIDQATSG